MRLNHRSACGGTRGAEPKHQTVVSITYAVMEDEGVERRDPRGYSNQKNWNLGICGKVFVTGCSQPPIWDAKK